MLAASTHAPAPAVVMQHTTWQLGAPMVSLFYGLRLVASIIESKIILSYTVISTGVQASAGSWHAFGTGAARAYGTNAAPSQPCSSLF